MSLYSFWFVQQTRKAKQNVLGLPGSHDGDIQTQRKSIKTSSDLTAAKLSAIIFVKKDLSELICYFFAIKLIFNSAFNFLGYLKKKLRSAVTPGFDSSRCTEERKKGHHHSDKQLQGSLKATCEWRVLNYRMPWKDE